MDDAKNRLAKEEAKGRKEQAGGAFDEVKGKVKKAVGDAIDDGQMHAEGTAEQMAGKARKMAGDAHADAADKAGDALGKIKK